MPVRNEGVHLVDAVASVLAQGYPGRLDLGIAVAPSEDDTALIASRLADGDERVRVVDNPTGRTPAGLNAAIAATDGDVVVRVDGHAALSPGYIERAVATMCRTGAVNVGGVQQARGETPFEEAVAAAMTSRLGTGGARFHVGGAAGEVDTVYLGVFDRAAGDAVGWFDDSLIRNQDYELNIRLRKAGGTVWFDPELWASYRPRGSFRALARQYYEYGYWKAEVLRREPGSIKLRQAVPPLAIGGVVAGALVASRRPAAAILPFGYLAALLCAGRSEPSPYRTAAALATMHTSWSGGLVAGAIAAVRGVHRIRSARLLPDPKATRAASTAGPFAASRR